MSYENILEGQYCRHARSKLSSLSDLEDRRKLAFSALRFDRIFFEPMHTRLVNRQPNTHSERGLRLQQILDTLIRAYWSGNVDYRGWKSLVQELIAFDVDEQFVIDQPFSYAVLLRAFIELSSVDVREVAEQSLYASTSVLTTLWPEASSAASRSVSRESDSCFSVDKFEHLVTLRSWVSVHNPGCDLLRMWSSQDVELINDRIRASSLSGTRGRMLAWEQSRLFAQTLRWMVDLPERFDGDRNTWWADVEAKRSYLPDPIDWIIT